MDHAVHAAAALPTVGIGIAVQNPSTGYPTMLALALAAGIGGGNFASSMSNISFFFPSDRKGTALGLNAGLGNLGVSIVQFVVPLAIGAALFGAFGGAPQHPADGAAPALWLQNAGFVWVPAILVVAWLAWRDMDDLEVVRASLGEQTTIVLRQRHLDHVLALHRHVRLLHRLLRGLPARAEVQYGGLDATTYAFPGPLVGALARPAGGWLADRHGGATVVITALPRWPAPSR